MNLSRVLTLGFWKIFLLWSIIGLIVFTLFGFFALPYILKYVVETQATKLLHRQTTVQEVQFNPFHLTLQVKGFDIKDRNGSDPFVSFEELALDLEAASVWERGPIVRDVLLKAPQVSIVRNEDLSYNFSDLLTEFAAKPETPPKSPAAEPLHFSINNIRLENGSIDFADRPKHAQHTVRDLNIGVPFLSNLPYAIDVYTEPSFAVKVNGTPIELTGRSKPFSDSRETSLDVNINNVELPKYLEYVPADLRFKLNSGSLNTKLALSFTQPKDQTPALIVNGKVGLNQLAVTDVEDHPILTLPLLDVPVESLDVFGRQVNLGTILLQSPEVHLRLDKAGILNVTTLVGEQKVEEKTEPGKPKTEIAQSKTERETEEKAEQQKTEIETGQKKTETGTETKKKQPETEEKVDTAPTVVEISEVRLTDGKVTFIDETQEKPFQTTLDDLNIAIRQVSTDATKPVTVEVSGKSDAGEMIQQSGTVSREPLKAEGSVSLRQIPVNRYATYYAKHLLFDIEDGKLDVSTQYAYAKGPENNPSPVLSGLAVTLSALRLRKRGEKEDFLKIPALAVKNTTIDVEKQTVTVGEVATSKGALQVRRESNGMLNLASLTPSSSAPAPEKKAVVLSRKGKKTSKEPASPVAKDAPAPAWLVQVKKIALDQYAVRFDDKVPPQPVTVLADPLSISLENFSTEKNNKVKAALRVTLNKRGTIAVDGPLSLSPLAATLKVSSKDLDILPFRPYFVDKLKIALTSGAASAEGNVTLQSAGETDLKVTYAGQASVTKLATINKVTSEDFLKWKSLYVTGINVNTSPFRVDINEVALTDFYSRLTINPDTTLNVQGIMVDQPPTAQSAGTPQAVTSSTPPAQSAGSATGESNPIKIAKVTLQGGTVDFSDHFIKPNYSAKLTQLGGRVSALISTSADPADVNLRGSLDNVAPFEITGKINPFSKDLFVDLSVDFKDIDLNPMTPYAGKYAGYTIEKGKLTLNLKYLITNRQLKAENKVLIDQFTFGDSVISPDATGLPIKLAISLLKDRNGAIKLDLPLTGSLDDPQFSVWGMIIQVLTNLIAKSATAPFALIGAALGGGGGEEMNQVEFAYGRALLDEPAQEKMKKMSEALTDRPSLSLDISGYAEKEKDVDGLKLYRFERKLKAQKLNDEGKKDSESASLDEVKIEPDEYLKYLTMAYKKEPFPKPRNVVGLAKDLPQEEMETLMFTNIEVTDEDLHDLAKQRAATVRDYLLKTGQLEAGRLFLVEPKSIFAEQKDAVTGSRVELAIK